MNIEKEEWKPVEGYEGLYDVSNLGRVKSLFDGRRKIFREKILNPTTNSWGYLHVSLYKSGKHKYFKVHRLVASAFIENHQNFKEVNHKNEIKSDNRVENLEWCTRDYNINYGNRNERVSKAQSKSVLQFTKNGELVKEWPSMSECGRNGFDKQNVSACCRGKLKSHRGFIWKYRT